MAIYVHMIRCSQRSISQILWKSLGEANGCFEVLSSSDIRPVQTVRRSKDLVIPDFFQKSQLFSSHQTWSSHPFMKIYPNYLQSIHPAIKPLRSGSMHICPNKNHWKKKPRHRPSSKCLSLTKKWDEFHPAYDIDGFMKVSTGPEGVCLLKLSSCLVKARLPDCSSVSIPMFLWFYPFFPDLFRT